MGKLGYTQELTYRDNVELRNNSRIAPDIAKKYGQWFMTAQDACVRACVVDLCTGAQGVVVCRHTAYPAVSADVIGALVTQRKDKCIVLHQQQVVVRQEEVDAFAEMEQWRSSLDVEPVSEYVSRVHAAYIPAAMQADLRAYLKDYCVTFEQAISEVAGGRGGLYRTAMNAFLKVPALPLETQFVSSDTDSDEPQLVFL